MVSKVDLAVVAALVAGCTFWIERGHRITIDAPTPSELAMASDAKPCPDNDRGPYSADCLAFLKGDSDPPTGWQMVVVRIPAMPAHEPASESASEPANRSTSESKRADLNAAACPVNDNTPYPPDCLRFLTGPFWRPE